MSPRPLPPPGTGEAPPARPGPWTWSLAAGWLPAMGIGFTFSALADRLVFVGWGLASALLYSWALRRGFLGGRPLAWGLLGSAAALAGLGLLVSRHQESLDLGYRAFLPGLYHPWITRPATPFGLGIVCGAGAALARMGSPSRNRRPSKVRRTSR